MKKAFDRETYDADDPAKHAVMAVFNSWGFDTRLNHDVYGIDLVGRDSHGLFGIEVEVKHNWTEQFHFPFSTVHYAARKLKFLDAFPTVWFATVNHHRTHALVVSTDYFSEARLIRKHTSHTNDEWFIELPIDLFHQVAL
jgi:hypothetical protein